MKNVNELYKKNISVKGNHKHFALANKSYDKIKMDYIKLCLNR